MNQSIADQIAALDHMTVRELKEHHLDVVGEPARSSHRVQLIKRLQHEIQVRAEGGLSERARRRAKALARESDLRLFAPSGHTEAHAFTPSQKRTELIPGDRSSRVSTRGARSGSPSWRRVSSVGGETYRSLSAVAKAVTGSHWNGHLFFGLP